MGIAEVLTILFAVLKCTGVIGWSWWLVFLPEIIAAVFYVEVFILAKVVNKLPEEERVLSDKELEERFGGKK